MLIYRGIEKSFDRPFTVDLPCTQEAICGKVSICVDESILDATRPAYEYLKMLS